MTLRDVLAKPVTVPATPAEVRVAGHLVRWILDSGPNEQVVRVPTRGQVSMMSCIQLSKGLFTKINIQPISLVPVSGCRISSSGASRRTLKRRTQPHTQHCQWRGILSSAEGRDTVLNHGTEGGASPTGTTTSGDTH